MINTIINEHVWYDVIDDVFIISFVPCYQVNMHNYMASAIVKLGEL